MLNTLIAERYAKALLRAAQAEGALDDLGGQAQGLAQALQAAEGVGRFLADPVAEPQAKLAVLEAAFEGRPHALLRSFLQAVLAQKRERFLPLILAEFLRLRDEAQGRAQASLGTARPLAPAELKLLQDGLSRRLGRQITLKPYTERDLLGGAVLRLGDTVYDASLRGRLQRLGRLLSEAPLPKPKAAAPPAKPSKAKAKAKPKPKAKAAVAKPAAKKKAPAKAKAVKVKPAKAVKIRPSAAGQALAAKLLKKKD